MVRSWDVASDLPAFDVRSLVTAERQALLAVLRELSADEWTRETACIGWSVHDVALHLLGNDFGRLHPPSPAARQGSEQFRELAATIERSNDAWVNESRRIPPQIVPDLLALTGDRVDVAFAAVDLEAPGVSVLWTGTGPTPYWLDIAREYTERWVHQAQIREAVGKQPLVAARWLHPVLDTLMRSLPRAYETLSEPIGTSVVVLVAGEAGGSWRIERGRDRWHLVASESADADAVVELSVDSAWRLLTRMGDIEAMRRAARVRGASHLAQRALNAVAVMTTRL